MFLSVQAGPSALAGPVPDTEIKAVSASHPAYNTTVNQLTYAAFTDIEPQESSVSLSGYGAVNAANSSITIEFQRPLSIKSADVQTLKRATLGSWGINYLSGVQLQALVNGVWETTYTFPGLGSGNVRGPDGKNFNESWPSNIPVGRTCTALRLFTASGYICASTFRPIMG